MSARHVHRNVSLFCFFLFFFNDTTTTEIYTLSLHDALPIYIASGFILLFERPIRVGDRITIGEDEGDVESINLRTTIVSTNDGIAIIIPNSKLVGQRVINWSYADPRARISIPIGVADDSDVDHVTKTLIEAAQGVEFVLKDPPPRVQFTKFGDYTLDFRLLVWTNQPRRHPQIRSDINYRIYQLFRQRTRS